MVAKLERAKDSVDNFIRANPEYALASDDRTYRGGTNVTFYGTRGDRPVVFKHMSSDKRYENELFCLRHFNAVGVAAEVLAVDGDGLETRFLIPLSWVRTPLHAAMQSPKKPLWSQRGF